MVGTQASPAVERGDLIEIFKILKDMMRINPALFWEVRQARNGARLVKELATSGSFLSYRVVQLDEQSLRGENVNVKLKREKKKNGIPFFYINILLLNLLFGVVSGWAEKVVEVG